MKSNLLALVIVGIIVVVLLSSVQREYFTQSGMQIYGPQFTSIATPSPKAPTSPDGTVKLTYPVLYGPDTSQVATPEPEAPAPDVPKKKTDLPRSAALPPPSNMGSDEKSKFLPYSRVPGDQDPYNMNADFTTSTYSSKVEPVPFLTDFSAFMK
jgi:hypothetical protein